MSWSLTDANYRANLSNAQAPLGAQLTQHRLFRYAGAPPVASLCPSGEDPDGVTDGSTWGPRVDGGFDNPSAGTYAVPGRPVRVETGGAFASGASLQCGVEGRVIAHLSGPVVMRALEASGASGQVIWAVFSSGR